MLFNSWIIIDLESFIAGKINYNWRIFHCHVTIIGGYSWGLNGIKLANCMIFVFSKKSVCPKTLSRPLGMVINPRFLGDHIFLGEPIFGLCVFSLMYRCGMHMVFSCWGAVLIYKVQRSFPRPKTMRLFGFVWTSSPSTWPIDREILRYPIYPYLLTTKSGSTTTI
jgi:hypothetical protein